MRERLVIVTDRQVAGSVDAMLARVAAALGAVPRGAALVMLREKDLDDAALTALGRRLRTLTGDAGARLVVNGRTAVAAGVAADGVHWPDDGEVPTAPWAGALVGASTHDRGGVARGTLGGAAYVTFGPVWATPSKAGILVPRGAAGLGAAVAVADGKLAVFALGGVESAERAGEAAAAGAHGVAVIRAIMTAADPGEAGAAAAALVAAVDAAPGRAA